ncbi:MAG: hypothetical protein ABIY90_19405 [Puia sp.]
MGTIKQGIPGGFSEKVGAVIGSSWKDIQVMCGRSTGRKGFNKAFSYNVLNAFTGVYLHSL